MHIQYQHCDKSSVVFEEHLRSIAMRKTFQLFQLVQRAHHPRASRKILSCSCDTSSETAAMKKPQRAQYGSDDDDHNNNTSSSSNKKKKKNKDNDKDKNKNKGRLRKGNRGLVNGPWSFLYRSIHHVEAF